MAERGGFEPPVHHKYTLVFETSPISRSGTSPCSVETSRRRSQRSAEQGTGAKLVMLRRAVPRARGARLFLVSALLAKELLQERAGFVGAHSFRDRYAMIQARIVEHLPERRAAAE